MSALLLQSGCTRQSKPVYQGYVEGEFVYVASPESGRLESLAVVRGSHVESGAPLFALESEREAAARRQAEQLLAAAEAQLKDLQSGKRPLELAVVREQLAQASAELKRAEADLHRNEAQVEAGGISAAQLEASRASAESSAARVRELERQLDVAALPAREEQIRAQEGAVAAARAALEQADWTLRQKAVAASASGVVFDTLYRVGEWVPAGRPVVRMLPPGNVKIRAFVPESLLGGLVLGQTVSIFVDGKAAAIPVKISYISTEAEYTPPIIYSNETRAKLIYRIEALPAIEDAAKLHPGQPLEVKLK